MRFKLLIVVFAVACCISVAPVQAGPVEFKFAHFINPIEPGPESGLWIEKDVNETISDKVKAKFFHSGQVGSAIEIIKKVRMGALQGAYLTGNYAPELDDKFGIGTLAFCMDSYEKWEALLANAALRKELFTCLEKKGLLVLDLCYFGRYGIASTKPFSTLEELQSLKMRTTQARYPLAFWKALGVNPLPMAWADVFPGLKQGVVDGTDQTKNVVRMRLTDVCKYFTETRHMVGLFFFVVNDKWWNGLDADTRDALGAIIADNMAKAREKSKQLTIEADAALKDKGVTVTELAPAEMAKFKEKEMKVWDQFESDIGKDWLDKIKAMNASME